MIEPLPAYSRDEAKTWLKIWGLPLLIVLAIIISVPFIAIPQLKSILSNRQEIITAREKLAAIAAKVDFLQGLNLDSLNSQVAFLETVLPSEKPVFLTLASIQVQAQKAQAFINDISFSPGPLATDSATQKQVSQAPVPGQTAEMDISAGVTGDKSQMLNLFGLLIQTRPLLQPKTLILNRNANPETPIDLIRAQAELIAYYSLPSANLTAIDAPLPEITSNQQAMMSTLENLEFVATFGAIPATEPHPNPFSF